MNCLKPFIFKLQVADDLVQISYRDFIGGTLGFTRIHLCKIFTFKTNLLDGKRILQTTWFVFGQHFAFSVSHY